MTSYELDLGYLSRIVPDPVVSLGENKKWLSH